MKLSPEKIQELAKIATEMERLIKIKQQVADEGKYYICQEYHQVSGVYLVRLLELSPELKWDIRLLIQRHIDLLRDQLRAAGVDI